MRLGNSHQTQGGSLDSPPAAPGRPLPIEIAGSLVGRTASVAVDMRAVDPALVGALLHGGLSGTRRLEPWKLGHTDGSWCV
jgi:hypothetical protein